MFVGARWRVAVGAPRVPTVTVRVFQETRMYDEKYKAIGIVLLTLARALDGGYVNFGVFSLCVGARPGARMTRCLLRSRRRLVINCMSACSYNDKALAHALECCVALALSVPYDHIKVRERALRATGALLHGSVFLFFGVCALRQAFPKVSRSYFQFLEVLFRNHLSGMCIVLVLCVRLPSRRALPPSQRWPRCRSIRFGT
jgi:hypothetical protein